VYLSGYYIEMMLKTIFFRCLGYRDDERIRKQDLSAAGTLAQDVFRITEASEQHHNPLFWARAIIGLRESDGLPTPEGVTNGLVWRAQRVSGNWLVRMRYMRDLARAEEWELVREDATWIRANYDTLTNLAPIGAAR
jgi:hypothetical protein